MCMGQRLAGRSCRGGRRGAGRLRGSALARRPAACRVGPDITAARPDLAPGATVLGARFQPGAAPHWLGLHLSDIVGCEVEPCRPVGPARA
ncbi:hypothetical protein ACU4GD_22680 [Cupriavidus basilensis]